MRRDSRIDVNQPEIVKALKDAGCSIQHLHFVGGGCPDILVGCDGLTIFGEISGELKALLCTLGVKVLDGANVLIEIKSPGGKLEDSQIEWHEKWRGPVVIADSAGVALETTGV